MQTDVIKFNTRIFCNCKLQVPASCSGFAILNLLIIGFVIRKLIPGDSQSPFQINKSFWYKPDCKYKSERAGGNYSSFHFLYIFVVIYLFIHLKEHRYEKVIINSIFSCFYPIQFFNFNSPARIA